MSYQVGTRVLAISHSDKSKAYVFGYGTYEGDKAPKDYPIDQQPAGMIGRFIVQEGRENPCIKLDNGKYVWGCECWWGPAEGAEEHLEGLEIKEIDIQETRKEWMKETN